MISLDKNGEKLINKGLGEPPKNWFLILFKRF